MSQTKAVAIFGACVLAAAIGLFVLMRDGDEPEGASPPRAATAEPTSGAKPPPPLAPTLDSGSGDKPVVTSSDSPRSPAGEVAEYDVGGRRVRDHRAGDHAPIDIPPAVVPPEGRRIPSTLTQEIGQRVRAKVAECAAAIPTEARGDKPRGEGLVVIAIKDKQVVVTSSTMQIRNVTGDSLAAAKQCIEAGAMTVTQPTTEPDLETYDITLSFAL